MSADSVSLQSRDVVTADGRRLRVQFAGDCRRVVVVQVGSPNAGVLSDRWVDDATARGLTLLTYDRPGYGESSPHPGRSVADCAADVRVISQAFGFGRCAVWGLSGGGPHALACAALLGDLVAAAATIGSLGPFDAPGLDFFAEREAAREDHELFVSDHAAWMREGEEQRHEILAMNAEQLADAWSAGKSPADVADLHDETGAWLYRAVQAGLAPGLVGWTDDDIAFRSPWGFDPASIAVPVKVWHGGQDGFVPIAHGRWLAAAIPGAEADLRDEDGHLTVAGRRIGEVHEWLAQYI
jgi:pimeloyl-ACP methyl ester carboxylesterase